MGQHIQERANPNFGKIEFKKSIRSQHVALSFEKV